MPLKKAQNKTFSSEEDGVPDANIRANAAGDASSVSHEEEDATPARDMDLSQLLEMIRNDFPSKISEVLCVIQDVKNEVQDFLSRLDEAEGRISKVSLLLALTNILSP